MIVVLFSTLFAHAQTKKWSLKTDSKVNWTQVAPSGNIILGTSKGLVHVSELDGKASWTFSSMGSLEEESIAFIPNTLLLRISRINGKLKEEVILNEESGKVIFDSKAQNLEIGKDYMLGQSGYLLIQGLQGLSSSIMLLNPSTGQQIWQKTDLFGKSIFSEVIDGSPLERDSLTMILATRGGRSGGGIYCMSLQSGDILWKADLPVVKGAQTSTQTETRLLKSFTQPGLFYFLRGSLIMGYAIADGKPVWSQPAKQRGLPSKLIYDIEGLIAASDIDPNNTMFRPTAMMYEYSSGNSIWAEPLKLSGGILQYRYTDQGLVVAMINSGQNTVVNLLDISAGVFRWKEPLELKGVLEALEVEGGVVYARTSMEELISTLQDGIPISTEKVKGEKDKPLLSLLKNGQYFTYSPKTEILYVTNLNSKSQQPLIKQKIDFEQSEQPTRIDEVGNLIVLSSAQTVMGISEAGEIRYKSFFPAAGISGWKKALYATSAMLNTFDAMRYKELEVKANKASAQMKTPQGRQLADAFAQLGNKGASIRMNQASQEFALLSKRFKASAGVNKYHFLLTKLKSGEFTLIGIDKQSGKTIAEINLGKQKQPKYELDEISKLIYLLGESEDSIDAYQY